MNFQNYKFRPSEIGNIMAGFSKQGLTIKQSETLEDYLSREKLTAMQEATLADLIAKRDAPSKLSSGGVTYVRNLVRQKYLGYRERIENRYMDKGIQCELSAILELNNNEFTNYEKFTEGTYENDYIISVGCDIKHERTTRDIKLSWSKKTHPLLREEAENTNYYWQGMCYMWLFDTDEHHLDHILTSTPDELRGYESEDLHDCDDLEWNKRYLTYKYDRDESVIEMIPKAVECARIEMQNYWNLISAK